MSVLTSEEAVMGNSTLPTVLDKLCTVANINTRKLIEIIKAELKIRESKIHALEQAINLLEEKMNYQPRRLDGLSSKLTEVGREL
jgi:hypothetical protein